MIKIRQAQQDAFGKDAVKECSGAGQKAAAPGEAVTPPTPPVQPAPSPAPPPGSPKAAGAAAAAPEISRQKQDGHVKGTPQHENRVKQGKPTSTFDGDGKTADELTQEAFAKGKDVPGRPGVKEYDFKRPIGTGPNGGKQTKVRVHQDAKGRIHGHPAGPEQ